MSFDDAAPFTVLVVCTGNICRSPLAEQLLRARFAEAGIPAKVLSAGTRAMVGSSMTSQAADLSTLYGGSPADHAPQDLTESLIANVDLVLTATREHRSAVVSLHPRASRYTYTLPQFARLVSTVAEERPTKEDASPVAEERPTKEDASRSAHPAETLRTYLAQIAATRGLTPPPTDPEADDVADPYRQSQDIYDSTGREIDAATATITAALAQAIGRR